jgi:hypothetical protein
LYIAENSARSCGHQIEVQALDNFLDVADPEIRIPAGIAMEHQRPQPELLLRHIGDIGTVEAAADPDDAIVVAVLALFLDLVDDGHDFLDATFIGMPVRLNAIIIVAAILAPAAPVELERRVAGIHDAVGADLVVLGRHFIQNIREKRTGRLGRNSQFHSKKPAGRTSV